MLGFSRLKAANNVDMFIKLIVYALIKSSDKNINVFDTKTFSTSKGTLGFSDQLISLKYVHVSLVTRMFHIVHHSFIHIFAPTNFE